MNYYALIKYEDPEKSEEEKCASEVEGLTPPLFDPKKLYNVFWSPNPKETLKQASKATAKHKYFPAGSANKGAGFYKARILLLEPSQKELQSKINEAGSRKLRAQRLVNDGASTSSKDSGLSASTSTTRSSGKHQSKKKQTRTINSINVLTPATTCVSLPPAEDVVRQEDQEEEQEERGKLQADAEPLRRELRNIQKKYKAAKERIEQLQTQLDEAESNCSRLLALNLHYQEHMVACKKAQSVDNPAVKCKCVQQGAEISSDKNLSISDKDLQEALTNDNILGDIFAMPMVIDGVDLVIEQEAPNAGAQLPPAIIAVQGGQEARAVAQQAPAAGLVGGQEQAPPNTTNIPAPAVPVQAVPQQAPAAGLVGGQEQAPPNTTNIPAPAVPVQAVPQQAPAAGLVGAQEQAEAPPNPPAPVEDVPHTDANGNEMVEIHPEVFLDKRVWEKENFKNFILNPLRSYGYGAANDLPFVRDAALHLWGSETLVLHTVKGIVSNANKARLGEGETPSAPAPALPSFEVQAIISVLERRVRIEEASPTPNGIERDPMSRKLRCNPGRVHKEIGQKIHALKRTKRGMEIIRNQARAP